MFCVFCGAYVLCWCCLSRSISFFFTHYCMVENVNWYWLETGQQRMELPWGHKDESENRIRCLSYTSFHGSLPSGTWPPREHSGYLSVNVCRLLGQSWFWSGYCVTFSPPFPFGYYWFLHYCFLSFWRSLPAFLHACPLLCLTHLRLRDNPPSPALILCPRLWNWVTG